MSMPRTRIPDNLRDKQQETEDENIVEGPHKGERNLLRWIRYYFIVLGVLCFTAVVFVFLWNLLASANHRWLSPGEMDRISNFAISIIVGLLISAMTTYFFSRRR